MADAPGAPLSALLASWDLSLAQRDVSPKTREVYARTGRQFVAWLEANQLPSDTEGIGAEHIRAFLAAETERTSAVSAHQHYRNLRVLFKWLIGDDERIAPDPMTKVKPPIVSAKVKPVLGGDEVAALLKACEGNDFEARRDMAILRIFLDTGVRVSGLANVKTEHVSLSHRTIKIKLKGGDEHLIPLGRKATAALDRYLRARARHKHAASQWLWLGMAGRDPGHFGAAGIQDMLERRGKAAGIERLTPHWFRRTFADAWERGGGSPFDGMRIAGWRTMAMYQHYAGATAQARAREAHAQLSPGDRF